MDCLYIEQKSTANLTLLEEDSQMKLFPVDRTFDYDSNGMHNSILTKMSLRHYCTQPMLHVCCFYRWCVEMCTVKRHGP